MATDKRKEQKKESAKRIHIEKKQAGYKGFYHLILPEWRGEIIRIIKEFEKTIKR